MLWGRKRRLNPGTTSLSGRNRGNDISTSDKENARLYVHNADINEDTKTWMTNDSILRSEFGQLTTGGFLQLPSRRAGIPSSKRGKARNWQYKRK